MPCVAKGTKERTTLLVKTINLLHQEVLHLVYTRSRLLYAQTKTWYTTEKLNSFSTLTPKGTQNRLLDSFCCIKLSFLWYYGQPGLKIISDLNAHPLHAGKTAAASFRRINPALVIQWAKTCPAQSAPSPPRHSSLYPSHAVWSIRTYYSLRNVLLSRNPSPRAAAAPIPDVYFAPVPTRVYDKTRPQASAMLFGKKYGEEKKESHKEPKFQFRTLSSIYISKIEIWISLALVETVFFPRCHHQHRWA